MIIRQERGPACLHPERWWRRMTWLWARLWSTSQKARSERVCRLYFGRRCPGRPGPCRCTPFDRFCCQSVRQAKNKGEQDVFYSIRTSHDRINSRITSDEPIRCGRHSDVGVFHLFARCDYLSIQTRYVQYPGDEQEINNPGKAVC